MIMTRKILNQYNIENRTGIIVMLLTLNHRNSRTNFNKISGNYQIINVVNQQTLKLYRSKILSELKIQPII